MAYTGLEIWWFYRQPYPWTAVPVLIASILVLCDVRLLYSGGFLAIVALFDTLRITYNQLQVGFAGRVKTDGPLLDTPTSTLLLDTPTSTPLLDTPTSTARCGITMAISTSTS